LFEVNLTELEQHFRDHPRARISRDYRSKYLGCIIRLLLSKVVNPELKSTSSNRLKSA
jgi:hypothetical protein